MREAIEKWCEFAFNVSTSDSTVERQSVNSFSGETINYTYSAAKNEIVIFVRSQDDYHDIYLYNEYKYNMEHLLDLVETFDKIM